MADGRLDWLPLDQARALAAELGVTDAQASRGAFRMLANHPALAGRVYGLLNQLMRGEALPLRLRELVVLRIAWLTGSAYQWGQHYRIATARAGLSDAEALAVRDWANVGSFGPADRAVLRAVDETLRDYAISAAGWDECRAALPDPKALVELVVAIGNWTMLSQIFRSLDVPLAEDAALWPPDGIGPSR